MRRVNKWNVLSLAFYTIAILFAAYAVWSLVVAVGVISEVLEYGSITLQDELHGILTYILTACGAYFFYALVLFALGYLMETDERKKTYDDDDDSLYYDDDDDDYDDETGDDFNDDSVSDVSDFNSELDVIIEPGFEPKPESESDSKTESVTILVAEPETETDSI